MVGRLNCSASSKHVFYKMSYKPKGHIDHIRGTCIYAYTTNVLNRVGYINAVL